MGILGKLLALPIKIVNVPIRVAEDLVNGCEPMPEKDRLFSKPLDLLATEIEKVDED